MTHQELNALYQERIPAIIPFIHKRSRGDDDLAQEACIAVFEGLQQDPKATNRYLKNRAQWSMTNTAHRGKSVDGRKFRKQPAPEILRLDHICIEDGIPFEAILPDPKRNDLEGQVINKIMVEKFRDYLTAAEDIYVEMKVHDEWSDMEVRRKTRWTQGRINEMKRTIRDKMEHVFAV